MANKKQQKANRVAKTLGKGERVLKINKNKKLI